MKTFWFITFYQQKVLSLVTHTDIGVTTGDIRNTIAAVLPLHGKHIELQADSRMDESDSDSDVVAVATSHKELVYIFHIHFLVICYHIGSFMFLAVKNAVITLLY